MPLAAFSKTSATAANLRDIPVFQADCLNTDRQRYNESMKPIQVGIAGLGWPGMMHARGYVAAGGFEIAAVADLIPERRRKAKAEFHVAVEIDQALKLTEDPRLDAISVCLPNDLHAPVVVAALRAGKHVVCEHPPAMDVKQAQQIEKAAGKSGKVVLYAAQRRFGANEQAARQAILKGYAGEIYHARGSWTRTRAIPRGTGWYTDKARSGGGSLIDIGIHMLDLGWQLLGQPRPVSVFGVSYQKFRDCLPPEVVFDVDEAAFALLRFEGNQSLELASSWALNQSPQQNGTILRAHGDKGAVEVYTPRGAMLHRGFDAQGQSRETALKLPRITGYPAMMRHFRDCIAGKTAPALGAPQGVILMRMIEGVYKSSQTGKSVAM